jgi:hypothetical protein
LREVKISKEFVGPSRKQARASAYLLGRGLPIFTEMLIKTFSETELPVKEFGETKVPL